MKELQKNITRQMAISLLLLLGQVIPVFAGLDHREHPDAPETYWQFRKSLASAKKGDAYSQYVTCLAYYTGRLLLVKESFDKAVDWCSQAAHQGLVKAQFYLGYFYLHGRFGTPRYHRKALSWLQLPERHDHAKALHWLQLAADKDYPRAQYYLGFMHEKGLGVASSHEKALYWYQRAAKGSFDARRALQDYQSFEKDLARIRKGEVSDSFGAYYLCLKGDIASERCTDALSWAIAAAEQGNWVAQGTLARLYLHGQLVRYGPRIPIDLAKARHYFYQLASREKSVAASVNQYQLALMYEQGLGGDKDLTQARHWYQQAADQGHKEARRAIKRLGQ